uniref:Cell cycle regulatory protein n=1 Tax=Ganoderma boninense TaxID=34458 RepID=A0A5K1K664_9APHY|nr:Cell cycle regulatory protein [Ganoderma boninense]
MSLAIPLAYALFSSAPALAAYNLAQEYSGSKFFDGWDWQDHVYDDTTHGHVFYLSEANAMAKPNPIAYLNDAGNAVIKVDNTSSVDYNNKRNSVRIATHDYFPVGSLFLFDAVHLPYGCAIWPGFWTKGPNWPQGGEIDIMEEVNLAPANQMTLHTEAGCTQASGVQQLGRTVGSDCSAGVNSAIGCSVAETQPNSYGAGFAENGGGVWATQFDATGVFVWFWSFGTPSRHGPLVLRHRPVLHSATLVLDITLCGDWAGQPNLYQSSCGGELGNTTVDMCYLYDVINLNQTALANAWFEISYIKVFTQSNASLEVPVSTSGSSVALSVVPNTGAASGTGAPTASSTSTSTSNGNGTNGNTSGNGGNGALTSASAYVAALGAAVVAASSWALL